MSRGVSPRKLLDLLAVAPAGQARSGHELAGHFGVSRAAIWKHVAALRAMGVPIRGQAGSGYRLDAPFEPLDAPRILAAAGCGLDVSVLWRCDSTNSELMRRAAHGERSGVACLAEIQTAGRGRRGRAWRMPLGSGLALSLLWRFESGMAGLGGLSLVAGIAVMRALGDLAIRGCGLKWPNDVVANDAKLAGILVELGGDALGPCHAVIGVGINLRIDRDAAHRAGLAIDQAWTDLATLAPAATPGRNAFAGRVLAHLGAVLERFTRDGFAAFKDEFARYDALAGRHVCVQAGNAVREAKALGIDAHGALRLRDQRGEFVVSSGEVSVRTAGRR